jgi:GntR family transcriptional repressor for pyruvate dehydrogenase complex
LASLKSKKKKMADIIIDELKRMLKSGELKEGDKLPNQNDFAAELGVSRPSLREALNQLTVHGIIEQKPGAGTIIKIGNPDLWNTGGHPPVLSDTKATLELLQARHELEPISIKLAVENMTEDELASIKDSFNKMETYYKNGELSSYMKEDVNFHYIIAKSGHNRFITQMLVNIKRLMEDFWSETSGKIEEMIPHSVEHHRAILNAIDKKNKEEAMNEIRIHIEDIKETIIAYYKKNNIL